MIPRPAQCDDDRCDYDETGTWRHHAQCRTQDPWPEDMAASTAREDGYSLPYGMVVHLPGRWSA